MHPRKIEPRRTVWLWAGAGALLLIPLFAMLASDEVAWGAEDFLAAAILVGAVCGGIELAARSGRGSLFVVAGAVALLGGLVIVWANLAVGIIGDEVTPLNVLFFGVVILGLALAALSRFRSSGMAAAMTVTAAAQVCAAAIAVAVTGDQAAIVSAALGAPFLLSAWLFRRSG